MHVMRPGTGWCIRCDRQVHRDPNPGPVRRLVDDYDPRTKAERIVDADPLADVSSTADEHAAYYAT